MWAFLVVILIVLCHASLPAIGGPLCGSVLIKMHNLSASLRVLGNKVVAYDVHTALRSATARHGNAAANATSNVGRGGFHPMLLTDPAVVFVPTCALGGGAQGAVMPAKQNPA